MYKHSDCHICQCTNLLTTVRLFQFCLSNVVDILIDHKLAVLVQLLYQLPYSLFEMISTHLVMEYGVNNIWISGSNSCGFSCSGLQVGSNVLKSHADWLVDQSNDKKIGA